MSRYYRSFLEESGPSYTARTTAFASATAITDTTILNALNTFDLGLISNGLDTKMKALYPFVGGTSTTHKYNFMDARDLDVAFRLQFFGGWTHSSTGALLNGSSYANTFLNPVTTLTTYNAHHSVYCRLDGSNAGFDIGNTNSPTYSNEFILASRRSNNAISALYDLNNPNGQVYNPYITSAKGLTLGSINSNTSSVLYKNGSNIGSNGALNTTTPSSYPLYIGAVNDKDTGVVEYTTNQYALMSIGDSLTDVESTTFYNLVQTMQTSLSRQV